MSDFDLSLLIDALSRAQALQVMPISDGTVTGALGVVYKGPNAGYQQFDVKAELDRFRTAPERRKGTSVAFSLESFIDLVHRHADDDSALFADILSPSPSITAVFDYHRPEESGAATAARFGQHRSVYQWPLSDEWKIWKAKDGVKFSQGEFAEFLEAHISELATATGDEQTRFEPELQTKFGTPNQIFNLSRGLEITVSSKFANPVRLDNGTASIQFEETHNGADGKPLTIPGLFLVAIPLFACGEIIRLPARLRYKKEGAALLWSYHLYRPDVFVRDALHTDLKTVAIETGKALYEGKPESITA